MRVIITLFLITFGTNLSAGETVYYCSMQNFVAAEPNKVENYQTTRFKMKISRDNLSSNTGKISFSNDHPPSGSFKFWSNTEYLRSESPVTTFVFDIDSGQMFQAWTSPNGAVAVSATCDEF